MNPLWKFSDNQGSFISSSADKINTLYFPLCNAYPIMASLSPDLHGDLKTNFHSFLLEPVTRAGLKNSRSSRNFWIYVNPKKIWSTTGVSKDIRALQKDKFQLEGGLLWQRITRKNQGIGLEAQITTFIPAALDPIEIMRVVITNISKHTIKFIPFAAIPVYARSVDNLHDHRHVTSLLQRLRIEKFGMVVKPTLAFDENGHKKNCTSYFVFGIDEKSHGPQYLYPTQEEFCGDNADLEAPQVIMHNLLPDKKRNIQGKEAMAALRFKEKALRPKESFTYIILMGIVDNEGVIKPLLNKYNTPVKIAKSLQETKNYWQKKSSEISVKTSDSDFDNWWRWVSIQPTLRRIFGCSFLPDFDYGKGGRGWRDLWQDALALIFTAPQEAKKLLINNFSGVRIDGSNATIIGQGKGEFMADRNNISRVWSDHGIWPWWTTFLYLQQSPDLSILLKETTYYRDHLLSRSQERDTTWSPASGNLLKTKNKKVYRGTILEHLLVQNLVQFFNVGAHNFIRLECADWNDGLDMASESGESVAFSSIYALNLKNLAETLSKLKQEKIVLLKELTILLDSLTQKPIDYANLKEKRRVLDKYFQAVKYAVSGQRIALSRTEIINDLSRKADWLLAQIRKNAWLKEGFFNGYYNNDRKRLEGKINGRIQMTLTGQVFPILSGAATKLQIKILLQMAKKYLWDKNLGGFHLNTDFKEEQLNLGRAFSFVYGDKENGAFFNHMSAMFAYSLYARGFAQEGYSALNSIFKMAISTQSSKIYPCLPEYFNAQGQGMYTYLTGSASWFIFTLLTQAFGIKGEYADLVIEPKLVSQQFKPKDTLSISCFFAARRIEVRFINPHRKDFGQYLISKVNFNGNTIARNLNSARFKISRQAFLHLAKKDGNLIEITLD